MIKKTAADIFIENYIDPETGVSEIIFIDDLVAAHGDMFMSNNGCQWARKGSKLTNKYIFQRFNAKEMGVTEIYRWNKIVAVQALGFQDDRNKENHQIPQEVRSELKDKKCVVLYVQTSDMEIDHKNGKYNSTEYEINDFQRMTKAVNDAKREHCKKCNTSGCRFKASVLGYSVDFIEGDETSPTCQGCYWYDPVEFKKHLQEKKS
jgi:hypothetical protein